MDLRRLPIFDPERSSAGMRKVPGEAVGSPFVVDLRCDVEDHVAEAHARRESARRSPQIAPRLTSDDRIATLLSSRRTRAVSPNLMNS